MNQLPEIEISGESRKKSGRSKLTPPPPKQLRINAAAAPPPSSPPRTFALGSFGDFLLGVALGILLIDFLDDEFGNGSRRIRVPQQLDLLGNLVWMARRRDGET